MERLKIKHKHNKGACCRNTEVRQWLNKSVIIYFKYVNSSLSLSRTINATFATIIYFILFYLKIVFIFFNYNEQRQ